MQAPWKSAAHFFKAHYHRRYHGIYHHAKQLFVFDLFLLTLALVMLGGSVFFYFWKPTKLVEVQIALGEGRVVSGQAVGLTISYTNNSAYRLLDSVLALRLPPGFIIDRSQTPTDTLSEQSTAALGVLEPGGKGMVAIRGTFFATPGTEEHISAVLSYNQENTKKRNQEITLFLANLPGSVLEGMLTVATNTFPNRPLPFAYTLTNTGSEKVSDISLTFSPKPSTATPSAPFALAPKQTLTVTGTIAVLADRTTDLVVRAEPTITAGGRAFSQGVIEKTVAIFAPRVASRAALTGTRSFVSPGETVPVTVNWHNTSNFTTTNNRLRLTLTPGVVDLTATARGNNLAVEGSTLVVYPKHRTALSNGAPGAEDSFEIQVKLLPRWPNKPIGATKLLITPSFEAEISDVPGQLFSQAGTAAEVPLATELSISGEVRYFTDEGDQLGRGPLPPAAGQTTRYWVFIIIRNTTNAVRDVSFRGALPSYASLTGKQSVTIGSPVTYDKNAQTISWNHRLLPPHSETGLYFEVAVTPSESDRGRTLTVLNGATVSATDDTVNKPFTLSLPTLSNILSAGDRGAARGAVVE